MWVALVHLPIGDNLPRSILKAVYVELVQFGQTAEKGITVITVTEVIRLETSTLLHL